MADEVDARDEAVDDEPAERAVTLEDVHVRAWEERQKAPVMDDPTVVTAGTADEVKESMRAAFEDELDRRFSPVTTPAQAQTDSAHNPTATRPTTSEEGEQEPVGGVATEHVDVSDPGDDPAYVSAPADEEDVERARVTGASVDSAYDSVTTSNDIRLDTEDEVDGPTPSEDVEDLIAWKEERGFADESDLDSSVDNRDQVDAALGREDPEDARRDDVPAADEADDSDKDLDHMNKAELLDEARARGVEVDEGQTKAQIKEALRNS